MMKEIKGHTTKETADFGIEINFDAKKESPANALRILSELIQVFEEFDTDLVSSIDSKIKPILLLEDIQVGSVKTWLKERLETVDDEGLKEMDWKKIVGTYLVKAKYSTIKFLEGKTELTNRKDIQGLEQELFRLAKETDIKKFPEYTPITSAKLVKNLSNISNTVRSLSEGDSASIFLYEEKASFNLELNLSPESITDLLTKEEITSQSTMILKVKKPDYLGDSRWELRHERKPVDAKISDMDWLKSFQNRESDVRPGDSLRAEIITIVKYDHNNEVIGIDYEITKVLEVIKPEGDSQINLIETDNSV